MTTPLQARAGRYVRDAARAVERAPVEVCVVVFLAVAFSWAVEEGGDALRVWFEILFAAALVLVAAWTGTLLHATGAWSVRWRWAVTLAGAAAAAVHAVLVPEFDRTAEVWRAVLLGAAGVLWLTAVPVFAGWRDSAADAVRAINGRFLLRTLGALLYTGALFAGLALALAAVDNLFELDLDGKLYVHVFGWLMLVLAPWIVIGGLDEYVRPLEGHSAVAGVVHRMMGFLVPPLLALYYVILYAYAVRIAVTGEIPKNLVSPMVLAAAALGALALFLFEPRGDDDGGGGRYLRYAPPLLLPLIALGVWAILLRVGQYGWTEFRLLRLLVLIVFGALAIGATYELVRRRRFSLHVIPLALSATLLLAALGPWSVLAVSRRNQQARLDAALAAAAASGPLPAPEERTIPGELYEQIRSSAFYLAGHFGADALPPLLRAHATDRGTIFDLAARIGLRREPPPLTGERYVHARVELGSGVRVSAALVLHRLAVGTGAAEPRPGPGPVDVPSDLTGFLDGTVVRIRNGAELLTADLSDVAAAVREDDTGRGAQLPPDAARVLVTGADGEARGTLIVLELMGRHTGDRFEITRVELLLLLET